MSVRMETMWREVTAQIAQVQHHKHMNNCVNLLNLGGGSLCH